MTESQREHGTGKTAGLPGENADPRNSRVPEEELGDAVAMGDVAPVPDSDEDPAADR